jgi:hypothetical protein
MSNNLSPQLFAFGLEYSDLVSKQHFQQVYYLKWNGVNNGIIAPEFVDMTPEEQAKIAPVVKEKIGFI